jgi:hypothetical protein
MSNLQFYRNNDIVIPVDLPVDITGATVLFTIKNTSDIDTADPTDSLALCKASTTSHIDPVNGKTTITLTGSVASPLNTTDITPGEYSWDITTKDASGNILTRGIGLVDVLETVTQRTT